MSQSVGVRASGNISRSARDGRRITARVTSRLVATAMGMVVAFCGCAGHASLHLIPTGPKPIKTVGPLITEISPEECYYWIDEEGDVCVAMRFEKRFFWDKRFDRDVTLSLVLSDPPAGSARYYRADGRTLRARERFGPTHRRWGSTTGVVLISDYGTGKIRGRFRITTAQQSYFVLTGWGRDQWTLMLGEFVAVEDPVAGKKILEYTEAGALAREPKQPVLPPADPPKDATSNAAG